MNVHFGLKRKQHLLTTSKEGGEGEEVDSGDEKKKVILIPFPPRGTMHTQFNLRKVGPTKGEGDHTPNQFPLEI